VLEEQIVTGKFSMECTNEVQMRGIIYSSNPRMECLTPEFEGIAADVSYEFHSEGLVEGDQVKGDFYIICNEGEYDLPFVMSVIKAYPMSSQGRIRSIFGFANLAQRSYEEAIKMFGQPEFATIFKSQEAEEYLFYQSLKQSHITMAMVEEFLIIAKKKKRVTFEIEEAEKEFQNITVPQRQLITLKKEQWGYLAIEVSCENEGIQLAKPFITTEEFVGNHAGVEYVIMPKKLHGGKNFARITFETFFERKTVEICITQEKSTQEKDRNFLEIQHHKRNLEKDYIEFRLHKAGTGVWAKKTCVQLDFLQNSEPGNLWYLLFKVQVLLINKQRQDAEWLLHAFRKENKDEKNSAIWAYYLYLCTLYEPEPSYVNRLTGEIKEIYHKNQENPLLLWILLFLDEELNGSRTKKLDAIKQQIEKGCNSPLLYLEAQLLFQKEPYLLQKAEKFERKILNFIRKQDALTKEVVEQVKHVISKISGYDFIWYQIMEFCYASFPDKELLKEICGYCIKWSCYGKKYMKWYVLGMREELRITGLYEAWVLSAETMQLKKIPKVITLYFQYNSNLAYEQQAMLYAAVIRNKETMKNVYLNYGKSMESFALDQVRVGRIDQNLAVIYKEWLAPAMLTEETAKGFANVIFTCWLQVLDENAKKVVVRQYQMKQEQIVPIVNHQAYIKLYGSSYCILLEDAKGGRYAPVEPIEAKQLLDCQPFLQKGIETAQQKIPYLLKYFDGKRIWQTYEREDLSYLTALQETEILSMDYRKELRAQLVAYYYDNYTGDMLDEFLLSLSFGGLEVGVRGKLMELLVARGHYEKAYDLILIYGSEHLSAAKLVSIIYNKILQIEEDVDDFLIGMCRTVFSRGKYNDLILRYMCRYFYGTTKELAQVWHTAREFEIDTGDLEERCIAQFLYTGGYTPYMEQIFEYYDENKGREAVVVAYLSQMTYKYLTCDMSVDDYVFKKIAALLSEEKELNENCRLGFLKWCSQQNVLQEQEEKWAARILDEEVEQGKYFPFYKNLPEKFAGKYQYYDKIFLEYDTKPGTKVMISYQNWGSQEYINSQMQEMYSGMYVKDFLLFFGESLPYYIKEETPQGYLVTQSGQIQNNELCTSAEGSRYDLLNDMVVSWQMKDEITFYKRLEEYWKMEQIADDFKIL
ncbi:MAG: DUF5717 family protein, partial [Lachnospiraceae bacterium]